MEKLLLNNFLLFSAHSAGRLLNLSFSFFLRFCLFIYLFDRERSQVGKEAGRGGGEAGSLSSREPDVGLHPRT